LLRNHFTFIAARADIGVQVVTEPKTAISV